jgi:hypothetical protein
VDRDRSRGVVAHLRLAGLAGRVALGLVACQQTADLLGTAPTFAAAPAMVAARAPLPFCGDENISLPDGTPDVAARACFWEAYEAGSPAEFVSTNTTMEGDPIITIYRVTDAGTVEVFIDSTKDRWSAMTWLRLECPELALDPAAQGQPAFGPAEGCVETTIE